MLQKVPQSFDNKFGITNYNGNITDKPCLLGIVPDGMNNVLYNGFLNQFMCILQIRRRGEADTNYDIKDIPFDMLIMQDNDFDKLDTSILNRIPKHYVLNFS